LHSQWDRAESRLKCVMPLHQDTETSAYMLHSEDLGQEDEA